MKNYIDDYYGPKKLSEESLASLIFEMEKAKKGSYKPEDYVTSDIFIPDKNANLPKVYPVSARGQKNIQDGQIFSTNMQPFIEISGRKTGIIAANMPIKSPSKQIFPSQ